MVVCYRRMEVCELSFAIELLALIAAGYGPLWSARGLALASP